MDWLRLDGGIFWVAGKAGSGKSTLMNFLWHHTKVHDVLTKWAGPEKLIIATHFFWNAGNNPMQMSQIGLLRSLLFQVFRQSPDLMTYLWDVVVPNSEHPRTSESDWDIQQLRKIFERLSCTSLSIKICFFIDELGEYNGDHYEIAQLFQKFSISANVKVCLSSRPWNVFRNAFGRGKNPSLMLENLTKKDIQSYVKDKLEDDYRFQALADSDSRYRELIHEVVSKAEGVFLWVVLVTKSLLNGLTDDNSIQDMQTRLRHFPSDLDEFFKHMMNGIEEVYKPQTA